jgi:hypothetical protein
MICEIFYGLVGLAFLYYLVLFLIGDADNATYLAKENKEYYRDKVVWITGASSGIGLQFCRHISALRVGAKLIISARTAKKLQDLAAELKAADDTKVFALYQGVESYVANWLLFKGRRCSVRFGQHRFAESGVRRRTQGVWWSY